MTWAVLANLLLIGTAAAATALGRGAPERLYALAQEDGALEWCTFWAFLVAAGIAIAGASRAWRQRPLPWCFAGLALFCFLVAMEEISWGQRLLGYRPPSYFLEHNFQQELNLHNIATTALRKLALTAIIAGYGVALPLLLLIRPLGNWASRWGLVAPPLALVPSFGVTLALYLLYPFRLTGEIVELLLGGCFLFAMLDATGLRPALPRSIVPARAAATLMASLLVVGLGLASTHWLVATHSTPELMALARAELEALDHDLGQVAASRERAFATKCGLHKRLYSFVRKYDVDDLRTLQFGSSSRPGVARERIDYFLDPWNSPYWIRHKCSKDRERRAVFVYSFGPDRRRDSSAWEVLGDDLGTYIAPGTEAL